MVRAVLDVNVLVSSLTGRPDRAPSQLVDAYRDGRFTLVVSPRLIAELRRVLGYPKLARWAGPDQGARWISGLIEQAVSLPDPDTEPVGFSDPKDEYLLALAAGPDVDFLVSGDALLVADAHVDGLRIIAPRSFADLVLYPRSDASLCTGARAARDCTAPGTNGRTR